MVLIWDQNKQCQCLTEEGTICERRASYLIDGKRYCNQHSRIFTMNTLPSSTKVRKFSKPSVDEVKAYCDSRNNNIDAEAFCDFYESKGWKVGNTPMKDWQAAVRTWEKAGSRAPQYQSTRKRMVTDKTERSRYVNPDGTLNLLGGSK